MEVAAIKINWSQQWWQRWQWQWWHGSKLLCDIVAAVCSKMEVGWKMKTISRRWQHGGSF